MSGRIARVLQWALVLLLGFLVWGLVAVVAARPQFHVAFDLSPQARFTMAPDTIALLEELRAGDQQVEIQTFYEPLEGLQPRSEAEQRILQIYRNLQGLTSDLLRLYERYGGERVTVRHHDLRRQGADTREAARIAALQRTNVVVVKLGERTKILDLDGELAEIEIPGGGMPNPGGRTALPMLRDYHGETAITSALRSLLAEGTPKLYVLTGYQEADIRAATALSYSEFAGALDDEGFVIAELDLEQQGSVPEDAAVLALLEPRRELSARAAGLLVDWLRRGGRMFVNVSYISQPASWNPTLEELGQRLGFELGEDLVCHLIVDPTSRRALGGPQAGLLQLALNPVHPATRALARSAASPTMHMARELRARPGALPEGVQVDLSLLRTGPLAWIEERVTAAPGAEPEVDWVQPDDRSVLAQRSVGAVIDIAPSGGERPGHLVLVSGLSFNNAGFKVGGNGDLGLNILQWLAERRVLVQVRGERYRSHRLELTPQRLDHVFWLLVAGVPGLLVLAGLGMFLVRRRA